MDLTQRIAWHFSAEPDGMTKITAKVFLDGQTIPKSMYVSNEILMENLAYCNQIILEDLGSCVERFMRNRTELDIQPSSCFFCGTNRYHLR